MKRREGSDHSRDALDPNGGGSAQRAVLLSVVVIVDLVFAVARGAAELPAFATLVGVRLADPRAEGLHQLGAVGPQVDVVAGVRAELVSRAMILAHAARFAGHVRQTQPTPLVPAAKQKHARTD